MKAVVYIFSSVSENVSLKFLVYSKSMIFQNWSNIVADVKVFACYYKN